MNFNLEPTNLAQAGVHSGRTLCLKPRGTLTHRGFPFPRPEGVTRKGRRGELLISSLLPLDGLLTSPTASPVGPRSEFRTPLSLPAVLCHLPLACLGKLSGRENFRAGYALTARAGRGLSLTGHTPASLTL